MKTLLNTLLILLALTVAVSAQIAPVNEPQVCYNCHSEMEALTNEKHVHAAFAGGACSDCHNPHASSHMGLLSSTAGELCISCHEDIAEDARLSAGHQPAGAGDCLTCHKPHASAHSELLTAETRALCGQCHSTTMQAWQTAEKMHAPVAGGACANCHDAHGTAHDGMINDDIPGLCVDCHDMDAEFTAAHSGWDLSGADCNTCHDPHAGSEVGMLMSNQHAPFEAGDCSGCHEGQSFAVSGSVREVCTACHTGVEKSMDMAFTHNLMDEESCMHCHNPHAAQSSGLLAAEQKVLCMRCHFVENIDKPREAYITHDGMDCSNCHTPHGSDDPMYLMADGIELCETCHPNAHVGSHPVGEDVINKDTGTPVTCLSCHTMHGADFPDYLPLDPKMDLCIQCHRR